MNKFKFGDRVWHEKYGLYSIAHNNPTMAQIPYLISESELTPATDWVKCSERMPEFGIEVLVFDGCDIEKDHVDVCAETCEVYFVNYGDTITHWMPLPAPPTESTQ